MIQIKIEGKEIYIPDDTTILLEVSNSIFNTEIIEGEIIFTFDVPAEKNDIIFQHARYVYVQRKRKYKAVISIAGIEIANGSLIIQKATAQKYSIGIILNSFPPNFPAKKLSENDYGDYDQLGEPQSEINANNRSIRQIIKVFNKSLDENSNIKFARFYDEKIYEGNENISVQALINSILIVDHQAFIIDDHKYNLVYVNNMETGTMFALNSYLSDTTFAPQIRLLYLLKNVFRSSGYELIGDITRDINIESLFYQSMKTLDAPYDDNNVGVNNYAIISASILLRQNTPNLTNSEFINAIKNLLGCTFYIDSKSKKIEMSFVKDLNQAAYIDLTKYYLTKETTIEGKEDTIYSYQLGAIEEKEIPQDRIIKIDKYAIDGPPPYLSNNPIIYAGYSIGKIFFFKDRNQYYISQYNKDRVKWEWVPYSGNTTKIYSSSRQNYTEEKKITPNIKIPTINTYIQIPQKGISIINNPIENENESDLILLRYTGENQENGIPITGDLIVNGWYTLMTPIDTIFPLTVNDSNSLGQIYALPYIQLLERHEIIKCQFIFPVNVFLEVIQLLKPQDTPTHLQKRWIMIEGVKMLPVQMKFQFKAGSENIKAEIKLAKQKYEL